MDRKLTKFMLTIITAATLFGCSGGGGPVAGVDRLGVSAGTVTGFGSVFVNGVEFDTDSAEFDIDDDTIGSEGDLNVGDIVIVTFDPNVPGVANSVFSDEAVEGPIDSFNGVINMVTCDLIVAGQCVLVDGATSFDNSIAPPSVAGLDQGDFIEVHGLFDSNGGIRATRIEPKPAGGEVEVHGKVSMLNTGNMTFMINALVVDYSGADVNDLPGGIPVEDGLVEAKGTINTGGTLLATKVEPDGLDAAGVDFDAFDEVEMEIEGLITRFVDEFDFDVAGFPVITTTGTMFEGGATGDPAKDLGLNVKVEVEGDLNDADVLVANKVDIRRSNKLRVTALVDQVPPVSAPGTLVVLGITVHVDALTRVEDKSNAKEPLFGLDDISVGNYVEVRGGVVPGSTDIFASLLEREDIPSPPGSDTELRGFVEGVTPDFTIAGVTIVTDSGTVFRDVDGNPISAATFFGPGPGSVQVGDLVDADGTASGTTLLADEVEFE